jgi:phenylacetate-CoA ligase
LIQEGEKDYIFKINADKSFHREAQLVSEFKSYLGSDANFIVEYVDEIPLLASGKRRKLVNNYRNAN